MNGFYLLANNIIRVLTQAPGAGVATWFLAVIFLWSGITKIRRPALAAMAMVNFKVVRQFRPRWGFALGIMEVCLALLLAANVLLSLTFSATAALL